MTDFDVQHRDCFDSLAAMRDAGGCDLILTSPPYPDARKPEAYGADFDTSLEGYQRLGDAVFEALRPGGVCALNIDGPVRKWRGEDIGSERSLIAFDVALDWAKRVGFRYIEHCAYNRLSTPISGDSGNPRWRSGFEPMHVFARTGGKVFFDRHASTRRAANAGRVTTQGRSRSRAGLPKISHRATVAERRCLTTNERHDNTNGVDHDHEAPFASTLADDYVLCYSPPGGLVGDPFAGSGTVPFSCHRHGRRFIGGDLGIRQRDGARWADVINDGLRQGRLL